LEFLPGKKLAFKAFEIVAVKATELLRSNTFWQEGRIPRNLFLQIVPTAYATL
jgi:hypothetical protein